MFVAPLAPFWTVGIETWKDKPPSLKELPFQLGKTDHKLTHKYITYQVAIIAIKENKARLGWGRRTQSLHGGHERPAKVVFDQPEGNEGNNCVTT